MPFVLIALGLLFLVVAVQGTQGSLFTLLKSEFVGTNSFIPWVAAFVILGLAGYIKPIRPLAHAFLALLFLVLVLVNGKGFFAQFNNALKNPMAPAVTPSAPSQSAVASGAVANPLAALNPSGISSNQSDALATSPYTLAPGLF